MAKNKQKTDSRTTLNGTLVTGVALDKNGIPIVNKSMKFLTIGRSGSVRYRGPDGEETQSENP